jgi:hypothetical protein
MSYLDDQKAELEAIREYQKSVFPSENKSSGYDIQDESTLNKISGSLMGAFGYDSNKGFSQEDFKKGIPAQIIGAGVDYIPNSFNSLNRNATKLGNSFRGPEEQRQIPEENRWESGEGALYDLTSLAGDFALYGATGALKGVPGVLADVGLTSAFAETDPLATGAETGAISAAIESIPKIGKKLGEGLDWTADKFTRKNYTEGIQNEMKKDFETTQKDALDYLNPLINEYGEKQLNNKGIWEIHKVADSNSNYLVGNVKKSYDVFMKNPSFKNAQTLQSDLATKSREIKGKDSTSYNEIEALKNVRESVLDQMGNGFDGMPKDAGEKFNTFRSKYRAGPAQYLNDPTLKKVVFGQTYGIEPKHIQNTLGKTAQKPVSSGAPENHPIRLFNEDIQSKMNRSDLYKQLSVIGPWAGKYGYDLPSKVIQNPETSKILGRDRDFRKYTKPLVGHETKKADEQSAVMQFISSLLERND